MSALGFILLALGALILYLGATHQTWLRKPLPAIPARVAGAASILAAQVAWLKAMQPLAAVFVLTTAAMAMFIIYPYLGALRLILSKPDHDAS